jgi:hypothetical protein
MRMILFLIASAAAFEGPFGVQPSEYASTIAATRLMQDNHAASKNSASLIFPSFYFPGLRQQTGLAGRR